MLVDTWSEIKGIEGAVWEALSREEKAEQLEKEAYEAWKKTGGAGEQASRTPNGPGFPGSCQMARGTGPELQGTSDRMQGSGRKLDKIKL